MRSVVTYLWEGREFLPKYVNALARMVKHHLPEPHRFICVSEVTAGFSSDVEVLPMPIAARALGRIKSPEGDKFPSSYRRLWTFSTDAAKALGEQVLMLDIDCIIVSDLRPLFRFTEDFVGWRVRPPPGGPMRFGGGTWLHRTGTRTHVYDRFVENPHGAISTARAAGYRGSDQAWISYCLTKTECFWPEPSGIYCAQDHRGIAARGPGRFTYRKATVRRHGRTFLVRRKVYEPGAITMPSDAKILHLNGAQKAWDMPGDAIVEEYWRPFSDGAAA